MAVSAPTSPPGRPWQPVAVFAWTLLASPLVGGAFAVLNTRRLGLDGLLAPTLLMAVLGLVGPIAVTRFMFPVDPLSPASVNVALLFRVLAAYYFLFTQREAFWSHVDAGGRRAGVLWPSLLALVAFPLQFLELMLASAPR